jgi:phage gp16-like protein
MSNQYPAKFKAADPKRREIQLIHIAKQQLGLDDETYRAMLWAIARVKSSTELDFKGRKDVLDHLKKSGFMVRPAHHERKVMRPLADDLQSTKIRALWLELHTAGKVRNPDESALAAFVKRQTKVDALQWLTTKQASAVIEELKKWLAR